MENLEIEKEILAEKKSISHLRAFFLVFLIAVIAIFAYSYYRATKHVGRQIADSSVFDTRLQNLENSIPLHEKRIAKLEEDLAKLKTPPTATAPAAPAESGDRITALEKEVGSLKSSATSENTEQVAQAITLLSTFHRLSTNIVSGKPFAAELSAFQEKFGTDTDKSLSEVISAITPYADNGIPTPTGLLASFDDTLASLKGNEAVPENATFWQMLIFNISHMITVRKIDKTQTGNSVDAITGRAEDDLENGAIEAAIAEIKSLPDNVRSNFSAWLEDAQIASSAPSIVDQIEEKVMKKAFSANKTN